MKKMNLVKVSATMLLALGMAATPVLAEEVDEVKPVDETVEVVENVEDKEEAGEVEETEVAPEEEQVEEGDILEVTVQHIHVTKSGEQKVLKTEVQEVRYDKSLSIKEQRLDVSMDTEIGEEYRFLDTTGVKEDATAIVYYSNEDGVESPLETVNDSEIKEEDKEEVKEDVKDDSKEESKDDSKEPAKDNLHSESKPTGDATTLLGLQGLAASSVAAAGYVIKKKKEQ